MDFIIIANAWSAGEKNPTSKHQIALELARQGHRVLWMEGAGMRQPSLGSASDRSRILRKIGAAFRGAKAEELFAADPRRQTQTAELDEFQPEISGRNSSNGCPLENSELGTRRKRPQTTDYRPSDVPTFRRVGTMEGKRQTRDEEPRTPNSELSNHPIPESPNQELRTKNSEPGLQTVEPLNREPLNLKGTIRVLSPLSIPLPAIPWIRKVNGWIYRALARRWSRKLGFQQPVLINYVPVLAEAMRGWGPEAGTAADPTRETTDYRLRTADHRLKSPELGTRNQERGGKTEDRGRKEETTDYGLRTTDHRLGESEFRIQKTVDSSQLSVVGRKPSLVLYHCVDRWDAFDMYDSRLMTEADRACCEYADVVIASSRDLYERCRKINPNTHLITHGVNYEHFARALERPAAETVDYRLQTADQKTEEEVFTTEFTEAPSFAKATAEKQSREEGLTTKNTQNAKKENGPGRLGEFQPETSGRNSPNGCPLEHQALSAAHVDSTIRDSIIGKPKSTPNSQISESTNFPINECPNSERSPVEPLNREPFNQLSERSPVSSPPSPGRKMAGFFGLLSEWVDQDLLVRLAREIPEVQVVLIGRADVPVAKLTAEKNIILTGEKPFEELPAYVAAFDVGIIPFVVNDLTRAVNPIKLREMLAGGCPVVSTELPEVTALKESLTDLPAGALEIATDSDSFIRLIRERLENPLSPEVRRAISATMRNETWEMKVRELVAVIGKRRQTADYGPEDGGRKE